MSTLSLEKVLVHIAFQVEIWQCISIFKMYLPSDFGLPGDSAVRNLPANARDIALIPGSGRSLGGGNGNPLQYSCLGNPMDRGAWRATVHGVTKSWTHRETELTHARRWMAHALKLPHSLKAFSKALFLGKVREGCS